ncbi:MAG TPA: hypothetical protein VF613_14255, partial [Longimicrobium sp.]
MTHRAELRSREAGRWSALDLNHLLGFGDAAQHRRFGCRALAADASTSSRGSGRLIAASSDAQPTHWARPLVVELENER